MPNTFVTLEWKVTSVGPTPPAVMLSLMKAVPIERRLPQLYGLLPVARDAAVAARDAILALEMTMVPISDAVATTTIGDDSGNALNSLTLTDSGHGYAAPPIVSFVGQADQSARAKAVMGADDQVVILDGGTGYTTAQVVFSGGQKAAGGKDAVGTATITGTSISAITVTDPGGPYNVPPDVAIVGDGTGFVGSAMLKVLSLTLISRGNGYTAAPTVVFTPLFKALFPDDTTSDATQASTMAGYMTHTFERHCKSRVQRLVGVS